MAQARRPVCTSIEIMYEYKYMTKYKSSSLQALSHVAVNWRVQMDELNP